MTFDDFWKAYPHCSRPPRSKKAITRGLFEQIATTGIQATIDGITLNLMSTAEQIVAAAMAYSEDIDRDYQATESENRQFVPASNVWLRQGRYEDYEQDAA